MNTSANTLPTPGAGAQNVRAVTSAFRPFLWSVRREIWETRSIYIVPAVSAIALLAGHLVMTTILRLRMHGAWPSDPERLHKLLGTHYEMGAVLIMGGAFLVGIFYSLEALYGERRDRSILFWKSMPVSDLTTVLSKAAIPLAVLPLLSFVITVATQVLMLLLSSLVLLGSGVSWWTLWAHSSLGHFPVMLLYHIVTVHGLWYAPIYGWLFFISAWAPRAPFLWAFVPPFLIGGAEKLAFNTTFFFDLLLHRLQGPEAPAPPGSNMMDIMSSLGPLQFLSEPGLWIGLAIAAAFLAAAVHLRRSRGPV
ncbi:MAG TPA: ABC transporter permease [Candidatus Angelobacter sp.]|jgi:ABC-2 type transport system permease protein